jgi:hypothetical protein
MAVVASHPPAALLRTTPAASKPDPSGLLSHFIKLVVHLENGNPGLIILRGLAHSVRSFARYLWAAPAQSYDGLNPEERIKLGNDLRANRIQVITTVVQALGGIAVLIGIYFAWANLKTTQEAQKDSQKNQTDALRITQEGQITDRFTKAIDQLGATDDKGNPRLELRLGGIYALERIAKESEKDHWSIMEVLTTYVRVHAPAKKTDDKPSGSDGANARSNNANPPGPVAIAAPSPDIQAILTIIGRRERNFEEGTSEHLDLTQTNLKDAHLEDAHLEGAHLNGANLEGAHLKHSIGLTQVQVDSAYGNKSTELPPGIVMPESWKHPTAAPTAAAPKSP